MKNRPFYVLAVILLTAVLPIDIASKTHASRGITAAARATATQDNQERETLRLEARRKFHVSGRLGVAALGIFVCGVGAWMLSLSRQEGGLQGVPLLLTALGILTQLILV